MEAYRALLALKEEGLVKDVGVSNYTVEDIEELVAAGITDLPAVNQIEINPFLYRRHTIEYGMSKGILPMSYRGLGVAKKLDNPILCELAEQLKVTPAQLLGRWLVQQNICHIPKSMNEGRIRENADIFSFEIPDNVNSILSAMTTEESLAVYKNHYLHRITRDTPLPVPKEARITLD